MFANLKLKQLLIRKKIPLETTWYDIKDDSRNADLINSLLRLLRIAAFMKYMMMYPKMNKSKYPIS